MSITFSICAASAQSFNTEITEGSKTSLQGKINKEGLSGEGYGSWFVKNYDAYAPTPEVTAQLKEELEGITIKAFMGTWCGDSKKEVPKLYKLLDAASFSLDRLTMVGVSREVETYKQSPGGEEEGLNVARVPTFIFYKDGKEINRFVERPIETLEKDILQLVQGEYQSSYQIIAKTGDLLTEMGLIKFQKKLKKTAKRLKPISKNHHELNAYASVLFFANKEQEAIAVARLNILLYAEEANTYVSLANKLKQTNNPKEAVTLYQKALALDPEHKQAKAGITQIESILK
ncbi:MAG: thiol-disulfide isomerase/thioredoxin [Patiriisocius sp.]